MHTAWHCRRTPGPERGLRRPVKPRSQLPRVSGTEIVSCVCCCFLLLVLCTAWCPAATWVVQHCFSSCTLVGGACNRTLANVSRFACISALQHVHDQYIVHKSFYMHSISASVCPSSATALHHSKLHGACNRLEQLLHANWLHDDGGKLRMRPGAKPCQTLTTSDFLFEKNLSHQPGKILSRPHSHKCGRQPSWQLPSPFKTQTGVGQNRGPPSMTDGTHLRGKAVLQPP